MATATMKPTTVRFDEKLKSEAVSILDSIGLGLNAYLTLSLRQLVNQRRVPFELVAAPEEPNEETRRALLLAEAKEAGLIEDDAVTFDSVDDAMAWLDGK
ncbi:type II toxin-antitoxin system RelB/DinJ family antitoxin [Thermophilibacter sp.]